MSENIFFNEKTPDDILFEKIKQIVIDDFSNANNITTIQIDKQTNRLFQACKISEEARKYIYSRIYQIR